MRAVVTFILMELSDCFETFVARLEFAIMLSLLDLPCNLELLSSILTYNHDFVFRCSPCTAICNKTTIPCQQLLFSSEIQHYCMETRDPLYHPFSVLHSNKYFIWCSHFLNRPISSVLCMPDIKPVQVFYRWTRDQLKLLLEYAMRLWFYWRSWIF